MRNFTLVLMITVSAMFAGCGNKNTVTDTAATVVKPDTTQQDEEKKKEQEEAARKKQQEDEKKKLDAFVKIRQAVIDLKTDNVDIHDPKWCRPEDRFSLIQTVRGSIEGHTFSDFSPTTSETAISDEELRANGIDHQEINTLYDKYGKEYMAFLKQVFANPHSAECGEGEGFRDFGDRVFVLETIHTLQKPFTYDEPIDSGWTDDVWQANMKIALHDKAIQYIAGKAYDFELLGPLDQYGVKLNEIGLTEAQRNKILSSPKFAGFGGA